MFIGNRPPPDDCVSIFFCRFVFCFLGSFLICEREMRWMTMTEYRIRYESKFKKPKRRRRRKKERNTDQEKSIWNSIFVLTFEMLKWCAAMPQSTSVVDFYHRFRRTPHENHCNLNQFWCVIFFWYIFRRSRCSLFNFRFLVRVRCCAHFSILFCGSRCRRRCSW